MNWLSGWKYRKSHIINPAVGAGTNYQIPIKVFRDYPEITSWSKYAGNPILSPEGTENITTWGYVVKSGATYHMYYAYETGGYRQIGHATSADGKSWTKDSTNNPVLTTAKGCWCPFVWIEDETWYMVLTVAQSGTVGGYVGISKSTDGIHWSAPIAIIQATAGTWDETGCESGGVIKVGNIYYVYYNTLWVTEPVERQSGIATTTDSPSIWTTTSFTKNSNNPIFKGGRFCGSAFKYGSYFYYIVPHYKYGTDYGQIELYRDANPTFYEGEREYLGIAINFGGLTEWDGRDLDVPSVLCDDIYRDSFAASGGELWCYYSGCINTNPILDSVTWYMGMTINANIDAALLPGSDNMDKVGLTGKCQGDFRDIRFTLDDGITTLNYWIEENEVWNYAKIWVKIPGDLSSESKTIYIYYGKEDAISASNGNNTFDLYEDFNSGNLDLGKWVRKGSLSETIVDGKLTMPNLPIAYDILPWNAICYGNGIWVAVASNGTNRAMVSTDNGVTWTQYPISAKVWRSVCYAPELGLFVAVGDNGAIATSPTGEIWTDRTPAVANNLKSVCWASALGLLVAVGDSGTGNRVQTSPDAITWTTRTSAADNAWQSVCWSQNLGRLVAVASSGTNAKAMYSDNGLDWTGTGNSAYAWQSVCWSQSLAIYVVVISNGGASATIVTSPDGINWTVRGVPDSVATWKAICWSEGLEKLIAVANGGSTYKRLMTSSDAINWSFVEIPMQIWTSVASYGNLVMCLSTDGDLNQILASNNGINWSIVKTPPLRILIDSIFNNIFDYRALIFCRKGSAGSSNYPFIAIRMPDRIDNRIFIHGSDNNKVSCKSVKDNVTTTVSGILVRNYNYGYHNFEIRKLPALVSFYQDEVKIADINTNIPTVSMVVSIEQSPYGSIQYIDVLYVRKCVSPEPTHDIWGAEEEGGAVFVPKIIMIM